MVDRGHRVESDLFSCLTCRKVGGRLMSFMVPDADSSIFK